MQRISLQITFSKTNPLQFPPFSLKTLTKLKNIIMHIKSLLIFVFMAIAINSLTAGPTIVMRGGARDGKYAFVISTRDGVICTGMGNTYCPVSWGTAYKGVQVKGTEIIEYVSSHIESGEKTGSATVNEVPFSWQAFDDGFEISLQTELILPDENEK
jgi:hypothetical protein